jgi:ATP synthase protein I
MVTELVAGLLVGFGIGLGLDALFGTRPWLLVLFTLLGFWAGIRVMMRTAGTSSAGVRKERRSRPAAERGEEDRG